MLVVAHVAFAALERPYEWDYFGIWGYKAHLFFETRSIPWPILRDADYAWIQRGHPLFAPLLYSVGAIVRGQWQDRDLGLLVTAFGVALILVVRGLVSEEHPSRFRRCLTTLAVAPGALSLWIGMAEGPLIAFGTSGILLIRRGLRRDSRRSIAAGAFLLGCAAMTKNEGTGLILAAAARPGLVTRWLETSLLVMARRCSPRPLDRFASGRSDSDRLLSGVLPARKERLLSAASILREILATPVNDHLSFGGRPWPRFFLLAWRRALTAERFSWRCCSFVFVRRSLQNFLVLVIRRRHIRFSWIGSSIRSVPWPLSPPPPSLGGNFEEGLNLRSGAQAWAGTLVGGWQQAPGPAERDFSLMDLI